MRILPLLGLIAWVTTPLAWAEEPPSISLAAVRALALERSPALRALDAEYAARLAEAVQVALPSNPQLSGSANVPVAWDTDRGESELELELSQPLRLSDFGTRTTVADLMTRSASAEQKLAVFKLLKEVDLAYLRVWTLQQQQLALEAAHRTALARAKNINAGAARGVYSDGDRALFAGDTARLEAELVGVKGDLRAAVARLTSLAGSRFSSTLFIKPPIPEHLNVEAIRDAEKLNALGPSQRASLLSELATRQTTLARRDRFPALTPRLLVSRSDEGATFVGAGFSVPLPFFDRNQGQVSQRETELRAARARTEYFNGDAFHEELRAMVDAFNLAVEEANLFDDKVIPAFRDSLQFQERQFASGTASVVQFWQTQRQLLEAQTRALELWTKVLSARIELELLIGKEL